MAWCTRAMTTAVALTLMACGTSGDDPDGPSTDQPSTDQPQPPPPEPEPEPDGLPSPKELYAQCEERVEQPQADGECDNDADCARAGCASEVCTTTASAEEITTTCEDKLCFKILDTCGCVEGVCAWKILEELPDNALPVERPDGTKPKGSLPPTEEGKDGKRGKRKGRKKD